MLRQLLKVGQVVDIDGLYSHLPIILLTVTARVENLLKQIGLLFARLPRVASFCTIHCVPFSGQRAMGLTLRPRL